MRRSSTPRRRYAETQDATLIWEGHKAGRHIGYCHIEKLHNLEQLPAHRLHGGVLPGEDRARFGRLDAGGGHPRRLKAARNNKQKQGENE